MHTGTAPRHASRSATMLPAMHTYMLFKQEIFFQVYQILNSDKYLGFRLEDYFNDSRVVLGWRVSCVFLWNKIK